MPVLASPVRLELCSRAQGPKLSGMDRALQAAQQGNFEFLSSMGQPELQQLLWQADEDGRTLVHAAAAR